MKQQYLREFIIPSITWCADVERLQCLVHRVSQSPSKPVECRVQSDVYHDVFCSIVKGISAEQYGHSTVINNTLKHSTNDSNMNFVWFQFAFDLCLNELLSSHAIKL